VCIQSGFVRFWLVGELVFAFKSVCVYVFYNMFVFVCVFYHLLACVYNLFLCDFGLLVS